MHGVAIKLYSVMKWMRPIFSSNRWFCRKCWGRLNWKTEPCHTVISTNRRYCCDFIWTTQRESILQIFSLYFVLNIKMISLIDSGNHFLLPWSFIQSVAVRTIGRSAQLMKLNISTKSKVPAQTSVSRTSTGCISVLNKGHFSQVSLSQWLGLFICSCDGGRGVGRVEDELADRPYVLSDMFHRLSGCCHESLPS